LTGRLLRWALQMDLPVPEYKDVLVCAFPAPNDRRKNLETPVGRKLHDLIDDVLFRLGVNLAAAPGQ